MSALDTLVVSLEVQSAALRTGLEDASSQISKFGKNVDAISSKLDAFASFKGFQIGEEVLSGLASFVQMGAEAAATMGKLAQSAGLPVDEFSKLSYAAQAAGISQDALASGLEKMDKNLAAAGGGAKQQTALFSALGIAVKDSGGSVRSTSDVLGDLADEFSQMQDGASKTALAIAVFGKSGADLIPFLNEGRDGIANLETEADKLGLTLSAQAAAGAKQFEDNLTKLELAGKSLATRVAGELAPALTGITQDLLNSKTAAGDMNGAVTVLSDVLKGLITVAVVGATALAAIGQQLGQKAAMFASLAKGDFGGAMEILDAGAEDSKALWTDLGDLFGKIWGPATQGAKALSDETARGSVNADAIFKKYEQGQKSISDAASAQKELTKALDEYNKQIAEASDGGKDPLAGITDRLTEGDLSKALDKVGVSADAMGKKIYAAAQKLEALKEHNLNVQLTFAEKLSGNQTDYDAQKRTQSFNNIGSSQGDVWAQQEKGFASFQDALDSYTKDVKDKAYYLDQAKELEQQGDTNAAEGVQLLAQQAGFAADKANDAASAFEAAAKKQSDMINGAIQIGIQSLTSNLGKLGTTIQAGISGFQQGGIWGALIAVIMQFITQCQGWTKIMNIGNGQFQMALNDMSTGLNNLLSGLQPLMGAIESIASAVHGILNPIFTLIGTILKGIAPVLEVVGQSLQVVGSTIGPLIQIIGGILDPIFKLMAATLSPLVILFMYLKVAADGISLGFNKFIDWVDHFFGSNNQGGLDAAQQAFDTDKASADSFAQSFVNDPFNALQNLDQSSADAAAALGATTDSATTASTALSAMTADLQNVPEGFKIALARFNATNPVAGGGVGGTASTSASPNVTVQVAGSVISSTELLTWIKNGLKSTQFVRHGTPVT